jgi:dephospho-CoA kinase
LRVGLTGGIGAGKSTVAGWLAEAGFRVVDADELVAELYGPGEPGAGVVRELFGKGYFDANGHVDRQKLAGFVFSDPEALTRLEERIHPLVRERFARQAEQSPGVIVLEATLLVESGYGPDFDLIVTVETEREYQIERAVSRGMDSEEVQKRLSAQGNGELRRRAAHRILRNDGSLRELREKVDKLIAELRQASHPDGRRNSVHV